MKLRKPQREDVNSIKRASLRALVASEPGTGKTPVSIRSIVETPGATPAVIVCPSSVTFNWKKELSRWAPNTTAHVIEDTSSPLPKTKCDFFIISWGLLDHWEEKLRRKKVKSVVADECHMAKNPEAIRSQALYRLAKGRPGLLLLSGTPIVNNEGELEVLKAIFGHEPLIVRRLLSEVAPDIPKKKRSYLQVELRPKHRELYDKANQEFEEWLTELKEQQGDFDFTGEIANEAFIKIGYLRRIVGEAKVPAASDWVARMVRLGEPVIVFAEHSIPLRKLSKALRKQRIRHCLLNGSTSPKKRQEMVDHFQDHQFPVFLASKAGKEGITLTAARHVMFLERFFTAAEEEQAEQRCNRIGQQFETTTWFLHAADTIDDRLDEIVRRKREIVEGNLKTDTVLDTPEAAVSALIARWDKHLEAPRAAAVIGAGSPLPALPSPRDTHAVVFRGSRWVHQSAARWCKMNGYKHDSKKDYGNRFHLVIHPVSSFQSGTFELLKVSSDISVIVGKRKRAHKKLSQGRTRTLL